MFGVLDSIANEPLVRPEVRPSQVGAAQRAGADGRTIGEVVLGMGEDR